MNEQEKRVRALSIEVDGVDTSLTTTFLKEAKAQALTLTLASTTQFNHLDLNLLEMCFRTLNENSNVAETKLNVHHLLRQTYVYAYQDRKFQRPVYAKMQDLKISLDVPNAIPYEEGEWALAELRLLGLMYRALTLAPKLSQYDQNEVTRLVERGLDNSKPNVDTLQALLDEVEAPATTYEPLDLTSRSSDTTYFIRTTIELLDTKARRSVNTEFLERWRTTFALSADYLSIDDLWTITEGFKYVKKSWFNVSRIDTPLAELIERLSPHVLDNSRARAKEAKEK